jgi:hypothetical protein
MEFNSRWHTHAPLPEQSDQALRELCRRYGRPEEGYSRLGTGDEIQRAKADSPITDKPA